MAILVFGADIVPTQSNEQFFIEGDVKHLFGDGLLEYFNRADFTCFNLECPLTGESEMAYHPKPHFKAKPETVNAFKALQPSLITIGNNHALDQGQIGIKNTMRVLTEAGIPFIGAGENAETASAPYYCTLDGSRIGIYTCSEYECSAATESRYGANHYDPLVSFDHVRKMKQNCDVAIVLYHGGKEHYRYPSPNMQRICRKFAEYGADLVICQHTHCIVCEEKYQDTTIVYGQGNVLLDNYEIEVRMTSLLVECCVENGRIVKVGYVPIKKTGECVRMTDAAESDEILEGFFRRSREIQEPDFIRAEYDRLAAEYYEGYVKKLAGNYRILNILNRLLGGRLYRNYYNREKALAVINIINTENHLELLAAGLRLVGREQKPE